MKHFIVRFTRKDEATGEVFSGVMPVYAANKKEARKRFINLQGVIGAELKIIEIAPRPSQT